MNKRQNKSFLQKAMYITIFVVITATTLFAGKFVSLATAQQYGDFEYSPYEYNSTNGLVSSAIITSYTGTGGWVTIPSSVTFEYWNDVTHTLVPYSVPVKCVSGGIFAGLSEVTHINFPYNVTISGDLRFTYCSKLTDVEVPDGVTKIVDSAFEGCSTLNYVTLPDGVISIGNRAFLGCNSLSNISLPTSMTSIGNYAFYNCISLPGVTTPGSMKSIGTNAFYGCTALKEAHLSGCSIGSAAFRECTSLTDVTITGCNIGDYAFCGCTSLNNAILYDQGTIGCSIGNNAFDGCTNLGWVSIGFCTKSIGNGAFRDCSRLPSISIPHSVESIGADAFRGCSKLASAQIMAGSIGDRAFQGCTSLTYLYITDLGVTSIGNYAFSGCTSLTSLEIPKCVNSIGDNAFASCTALSNAVVLGGSIGNYAFSDCTALTNMTLSGTNSIGNYAFYNCEELISVNIPNTVSSIGQGAFEACRKLTSISVPNGITSLSREVFANCNKLTNISIPDSVTNIGAYAFWDCTELASITIPDSVTHIGDNAFGNCMALEQITIPKGVTTIENDLFYNCQNLTTVILPTDISSIGDYAFYNCHKLNSIDLPQNLVSIGSSSFFQCYALQNVNLPSSLTSIGEKAFRCCYKINNLTIPSGVTNIPYDAFSGCEELTSLTIPNSVTNIDVQAFAGCVRLTDVTLPSSLESIGTQAFRGCYGIEEITIPQNVTYIGDDAFNSCYSLSAARFLGNTPTTFGSCVFNNTDLNFRIYYISDKTGWTTPVWNGYAAYPDGTPTIDYTYTVTNDTATIIYYTGTGGDVCIPSTLGGYPVTSIGDYAFKGCSSLTGVTIPEGVSTVGLGAFYQCSNLGMVSLPASLTGIGPGSFAYTGLTNIAIPAGVTSIGGGAFSGCTGLRTVSIPAGVTSIGDWAFADCAGLTSIQIPDGITSIGNGVFSGCIGLNDLVIPIGITSIGNWAFEWCPALTSINIPAGVTTIGDGAFADCTGLTAVAIPDSVQSLGSGVFYNCGNLNSIVIPSGIVSIGDYSFFNCTSLLIIVIPDSVSSIGYNAFTGCSSLSSIAFESSSTLIYDDPSTLPDSTTIVGYDPSSARDYAIKYSRVFEAISSSLYDITIPPLTGGIIAPSTFSAVSGATITLTVTPDPGMQLKAGSVKYNDGVDHAIDESSLSFVMPASDVTISAEFEAIPVNKTALGEAISAANIDIASVAVSLDGSDVLPTNQWVTATVMQAYTEAIASTQTVYDNPAASQADTDGAFNLLQEATAVFDAAKSAGTNVVGSVQWSALTSPTVSTGYHQAVGTIQLIDNSGSTAMPGTIIQCILPEGVEYDAAPNASMSADYIDVPPSSGTFNNVLSPSDIQIMDESTNKILMISVAHKSVSTADEAVIINFLFNQTGSSRVNITNTGPVVMSFLSNNGSVLAGTQITNAIATAEPVLYTAQAALVSGGSLIVIPASASVGTVIYVSVSPDPGYQLKAGSLKYNDGTADTPISGASFTMPAANVIVSAEFETLQTPEYSYTMNNGKATITGYTGTGGDVSIPSTLGGYPVTSIGDYAFKGCSSLTGISIPEGVSTVGLGAFYQCSNLSTINLPASLTGIGYGSFACTGISSINIPGNVSAISNYAFYGDSSLASASFAGNAPASFGSDVFAGCASSFKVYYSSSSTGFTTPTWNGYPTYPEGTPPEDYKYTISGSTAQITGYTGTGGDVTIPATLGGYPVTSIGDYAFKGCSSLNSIGIPEGVSTIGPGAFYQCSNLTSVSLPASLTGIGYGSFACTGISSINIPASVSLIDSYAFYGCSNLNTVSLAGSVPASLGNNIFAGCAPDLSIYFYTISGSTAKISRYIGAGGDITIPSTLNGYPITSIGDYAFIGISNLTSIIIPEGVTSVGYAAFYQCSSLSTINLPSSLTSIGYGSFACTGISSINIPASVSSVDSYAFYGCSNLSAASFAGNAPATFGSSVFDNCASGFTIYYSSGAAGFTTPTWNGYQTVEI